MVKAGLFNMEFILIDKIYGRPIKNTKGKVAKFRLRDVDLENRAREKLRGFLKKLKHSDFEEIENV